MATDNATNPTVTVVLDGCGGSLNLNAFYQCAAEALNTGRMQEVHGRIGDRASLVAIENICPVTVSRSPEGTLILRFFAREFIAAMGAEVLDLVPEKTREDTGHRVFSAEGHHH